MNKRLIGFILGLTALLGCAGLVLAQSQVSTEPPHLPTFTGTGVLELVMRIVRWVFAFLMVLVILFVIIAGYLFVTGGGNPDQIARARQVLIYALIGFAVAMISRGIIALVAIIIGREVPTSPFGD